ncbi:SPFH domain-containing protein [Coralloluteibacterium thermophilus]|uniref:SPFH domain-containing protein n=1 Tax=Coralloluteibacterium thermophilum TaxID=2707049 RepID=A0ABV9NNG8_9GAMM
MLYAIAALIVVLLVLSARWVPEGQVHTVHRFGRYARALPPGIGFVIPGIERIAQRISLIDHHLEVPAPALGSDGTSADLYFQILGPRQAGSALEQVDAVMRQHADAALSELAQTRTDDQHAPSLSEALKSALNRRVSSMGLRVIRCALHS